MSYENEETNHLSETLDINTNYPPCKNCGLLSCRGKCLLNVKYLDCFHQYLYQRYLHLRSVEKYQNETYTVFVARHCHSWWHGKSVEKSGLPMFSSFLECKEQRLFQLNFPIFSIRFVSRSNHIISIIPGFSYIQYIYVFVCY